MADRTNGPGMDDEALDGLLRRAGAHWRDDNTDPAPVDLAAITATASTRDVPAPQPPLGPDDPDRAHEAAGEYATDEALPLVPDPDRSDRFGRRRSRTARTALAALAAAAVVAGLTVGLLQLTGGSGGGHSPAADGPFSSAPASRGDDAGAAVIGPDWQLVATTGPDGTALPVAVPAHFRLDGSGLDYSDGCNSGGGQATVTGSTITFAKLIHTAIACASSEPGPFQQEQLIDSVVSGSVHWAVRAGVLTLSKPGVGTLSYAAAHATPAVNPDSVFAGTWTLQTIQPGDNFAQAYGTAQSAPRGARITWGKDGLTGFGGCNSFRSDYHYVGEASGGSLTLSNFVVVPPAKPCPSSEWTQILQEATHWSFADGRLTITDAHGGALTFTAPNR